MEQKKAKGKKGKKREIAKNITNFTSAHNRTLLKYANFALLQNITPHMASFSE